jgi:hypothetical protein
VLNARRLFSIGFFTTRWDGNRVFIGGGRLECNKKRNGEEEQCGTNLVDTGSMLQSGTTFSTGSHTLGSAGTIGLGTVTFTEQLAFTCNFAGKILNSGQNVGGWIRKPSVVGMEGRAKGEDTFADLRDKRKRGNLRPERKLGWS